ncbi:unnamed protein product [Tilletia caries]|nr:unnamed protein product [Tilletia caries]CAD7068074.1 unnamed protein product [Tilletia caries]
MIQLRSRWRALDDSTVVARLEGLWLFELLLVWLNATFGLSEQVCALLLTFVEAIVAQTAQHAGWIPTLHTKPHMSVRLRRVRRSLWQGSISVTYALCPDGTCWTPHLLDDNTPYPCSRCGKPLLRGQDSSDDELDPPSAAVAGSDSIPSTTRSNSKRPKLSLHYEPISSWLLEIARREKFFDLCDEWRTRNQKPDVFEDIYDGAAW